MTNTPVSTKFEASNGIVVEQFLDKSILVGSSPLGSAQFLVALMEFAAHQRDEELGRWRSKERPEYVVYQNFPDDVQVTNETNGVGLRYTRGDKTHLYTHADVAREYFRAHPKQEPWKDAKLGEVWSIQFHGQTMDMTCVRERNGLDLSFFSRTHLFATNHVGITAGTRLYPEEKS